MQILRRDEIQSTRSDLSKAAILDSFDSLVAQLQPLVPLINSLQTITSTLSANAIFGVSYQASSLLLTDSNGTPGFSTGLSFPLAFTTSAIITPTALTTNTNDWNPTGWATAAVVRLSATGAVNLTGALAATSPSFKMLVNIGTNTITLKNNTTSQAANQFRTPSVADFSLTQFKTAWLWYDTTSSIWQVVG